MSQEKEDVDLLRQKSLRGGNRAVVTKLVKEVLLTTRESVDDTPINTGREVQVFEIARRKDSLKLFNCRN